MNDTEKWGKFLKDIETGKIRLDETYIPELYETACDMHDRISELEQGNEGLSKALDIVVAERDELEAQLEAERAVQAAQVRDRQELRSSNRRG